MIRSFLLRKAQSFLTLMVSLRVIFLCFCLVSGIASAQSSNSSDSQKLLHDALIVTANQFVYPSYQNLAVASTALKESLSTYCDGKGDYAKVHSDFASSFLAWQRASLIQLGPIMDAEGPMRFQLWPDPKGFARRAINRAVVKQSSSLLERGAMAGRSVAIVNLTTLELLLFDELVPNTYRCSLSIAIAEFHSNLAKELTKDWRPGSDFRYEHDNALPGKTQFSSSEDLLRKYLAGAVSYTDRLIKVKLLRGLGESQGNARAKRTEAYRSGLGLRSIAVSLQTLAEFLTLEGGIFQSARKLGGTDEHVVLALALQRLLSDLNLTKGNLMHIAEMDGIEAQKLREYNGFLLYLEEYLKQGFFEPIGITAGFSSADGD